MQSIIGLIFLVIVSIVIVTLRKRIYNSDNTMLKAATAAGDAIIWMRFIYGIIFFIFVIIMLSVFGKH